MKRLPEYWQGFVHDPMHHFNLPFDCIEFPDVSGRTLRGWWIPTQDPNPGLAIVCCHGGGRDRSLLSFCTAQAHKWGKKECFW